jgi:hypothetical protein
MEAVLDKALVATRQAGHLEMVVTHQVEAAPLARQVEAVDHLIVLQAEAAEAAAHQVDQVDLQVDQAAVLAEEVIKI